MAETGSNPAVDVSTIADASTRRAVRAVVNLNQQLQARIQHQQTEIEALLLMMIEKHIGSLGEFKRHILKLQSGEARSERIHSEIAAVTAAPPPPPAAAPAPPPVQPKREPRIAEPEIDRPRRYTL